MSRQISFFIDQKGQKIYFSLVEKESEAKFSFNQRILVLVNQKYIGYISKPNKKNLQSSVDIKKMKKMYALKDLRTTTPRGKQLTLCINDYQENSDKPKSIRWLFRMSDAELVNKWVQLIQKQNSPYTTRKTTLDNNQSNQQPQLNPTIQQITDGLKKKGFTQQQISKKRESEISFKGNSNIIQQNNDKDHKEQEKVNYYFEKQEKRQQFEKFDVKEIKGGKDIKENQKKKEEVQISKLLEKNIDYKKVQEEYNQYKKSIKKDKRAFSGLGSSVHLSTKKEHFSNYFRPPPLRLSSKQPKKQPDTIDSQFQSFIKFAQEQVQQIVLTKKQKNQNQGQQESIDEQNIFLRNGVIIKIISSQIKQIPGNNGVCDEGAIKRCLDQYKTMNYLWKVICYDEELAQIFLMPMSCIVQYAGHFAYVSCQFDNSHNANDFHDYSMHFQKLARLTKIHKSILQNQECIKFMKIGNKFVIYEVNQFLPRYINNATMMRPQLFSEHQVQKKGYLIKKGKREQQQQNKMFKQPLQNVIKQLSMSLQKLDESIVHPKQFTQLLHKNGLNINMMHKLYQKISNIFIKTLIKTQSTLRAFKMIFRKKLQESNEIKLQKTIKKILNILLSQHAESEVMWKLLNLHSENYYQMTVGRQEIDKGYFFMGLEYHLGIQIVTRHSGCSYIFACEDFVEDVKVKCKVKVCTFYWLEQQINQVPEQERSKAIIDTLELKTKKIPSYIKHNSTAYEQILQILSTTTKPSTFAHIKPYEKPSTSSQLTSNYFHRLLTKLKWHIKLSENSSEHTINQQIMLIKQQLYFYYENYHPFFSELSDLLIEYNVTDRNYERALQHCKNSLSNMIQICGGNTMHIKLASNYYQMANCYMDWKKYDDAIAYYKKAKNILEFNSYLGEKQYAIVLYKLSLLYLGKYRDQQAYKLLEIAWSILEKDIENNYIEIVQLLELISRCWLNDPVKKKMILQKSLTTIYIGLQNNISEDQDLLKLLKIILSTYFFINSQQLTFQFILYIQDSSDLLRKSNMDTQKSLQILKQFIINNKFLSTLENFSEKATFSSQNRSKFLDEKPNREIQMFQTLINSVVVVTSQGFMLGMLGEHFN